MMNKKSQAQISFLSLLMLSMLVNIFSQTTHETGHHLVYQLLGHGPVWGFTRLVQLGETPANPADWVETEGADGEQTWLKLTSPLTGSLEQAAAAASGPLVGLLGAVLGLWVATRSKQVHWREIGLAYALSGALVAVLYYARAPMRTGGDEYDVALQLGVTKTAVEVPLALAFTACLAFGLRLLPSWKARFKWLGAILLGSMATGILMVAADPVFTVGVDARTFWFRPVLGYVLPVLLTNLLAGAGLWLWSRQAITHRHSTPHA